MKKIIMIAIGVALLLCGTNSYKNSKNTKKEIETSKHYVSTIVPLDNESDDVINYRIKNCYKGKYKIRFYAKEYNRGEFIKEHSYFDIIKTFNEDGEFTDISITEKDSQISVANEDTVYSKSDIAFFNDIKGQVGISKIKKDKDFMLNTGVPIAVYSASEDRDFLNSINLDEYLNINSNGRDLIMFFKITKIK